MSGSPLGSEGILGHGNHGEAHARNLRDAGRPALERSLAAADHAPIEQGRRRALPSPGDPSRVTEPPAGAPEPTGRIQVNPCP